MLTVFKIPTGSGKSTIAREEAARRSLAGEAVIYSAPTHRLADEAARHFGELGVAVSQRRGAARLCGYEERAQKLTAAGGSVPLAMCPGCPQASTCPSRRPPAPGGVVVTVHALAAAAAGGRPAALLIVDEQPPLSGRHSATAEDAETARGEIHVLFQAADLLAPAMTALAELARSGGDADGARRVLEQGGDLLIARERAATAGIDLLREDPLDAAWELVQLAPRAYVPRIDLREGAEDHFACALRAMRAITVASAMGRGGRAEYHRGAVSAVALTPEADVLANHASVWLLDATADLDGIRAMRTDLRVLDIPALAPPSGVTPGKCLIRFERGCGQKLREDRERAAVLVAEGLDRARTANVRDLLLVTHKPLADLAREEGIARNALRGWRRGRRLTIEHFGGLRGLNVHSAVDGLITLGDPWPNLDDARAEAALLGLADGDARAQRAAQDELAQAHGRARNAGAWHLHVGALPPSGWTSSTTEIEEGPPVDQLGELVALIGGVKPVAKALGISTRALRRYLGGSRPAPAKIVRRVAEKLNEIGQV